MHSFEVQPNVSVCRKKVRLGLEQVITLCVSVNIFTVWLHVRALDHITSLVLIFACENLCTCKKISVYLTETFHCHISNYSVAYINNPVDVNTPSDAATPIGVN